MALDDAFLTDSYSRSFRSGSPIAQASIARDLANYADDEDPNAADDDSDSEASTMRPVKSVLGTTPHSLAGSYHRPSFFTAGPRGTVVPHSGDQELYLSRQERERALEEERDLLSDNNVIPSDRSRRESRNSLQKKTSASFLRTPSVSQAVDRHGSNSLPSSGDPLPTETTSLLRNADRGNTTEPSGIDRKWEEAVTAGLIQSTWWRETQVIGKYSLPLMVTFLLQYSLTVASIFTVGHLGTIELGAASLASMTVNITGSAVYQGLATSLDTLCAQAYGSGKKKLVGLQMQRMVYFLWVLTIPISILWLLADKILVFIIPEKEVALLASQYLKVVILGLPGYACFESGKRFVQAQGIFTASLYVLLICAPLNAFMNWFFVWVCN
jgi:MATE family multidrug resistance protein